MFLRLGQGAPIPLIGSSVCSRQTFPTSTKMVQQRGPLVSVPTVAFRSHPGADVGLLVSCNNFHCQHNTSRLLYTGSRCKIRHFFTVDSRNSNSNNEEICIYIISASFWQSQARFYGRTPPSSSLGSGTFLYFAAQRGAGTCSQPLMARLTQYLNHVPPVPLIGIHRGTWPGTDSSHATP